MSLPRTISRPAALVALALVALVAPAAVAAKRPVNPADRSRLPLDGRSPAGIDRRLGSLLDCPTVRRWHGCKATATQSFAVRARRPARRRTTRAAGRARDRSRTSLGTSPLRLVADQERLDDLRRRRRPSLMAQLRRSTATCSARSATRSGRQTRLDRSADGRETIRVHDRERRDRLRRLREIRGQDVLDRLRRRTSRSSSTSSDQGCGCGPRRGGHGAGVVGVGAGRAVATGVARRRRPPAARARERDREAVLGGLRGRRVDAVLDEREREHVAVGRAAVAGERGDVRERAGLRLAAVLRGACGASASASVPVRPATGSAARKRGVGAQRAQQRDDLARRGAVGAREARAVDDPRVRCRSGAIVRCTTAAPAAVEPAVPKRAPTSFSSISANRLSEGTSVSRTSVAIGGEATRASCLRAGRARCRSPGAARDAHAARGAARA